MRREEKIEKAKTLDEVVSLLSKNQISRFAAVICWYQVHNNFFYFLDERDTKKYLLDRCISKDFRFGTISCRRLLILNHIKVFKRKEMTEKLIELGKECARNKDAKTLSDLAQKANS